MSPHIPHFPSKVLRNALPVVAILASVCTLMAQAGPQGAFVGTVKDSTGASAPGVKVTVVNTGTQFVSQTVTNAEGFYNVPYLNSGMYRLTFVAEGFKQFVRDGIDLRPGGTPRFDVTLEIGSARESVTITAEAPLLNTESATVSNSMGQAILQDISNVSKRIVRDLYFVPGVIGSANTGYHILGNVQRAIGYSMDGVSAKWPGLGTFDQNDQVLQTTQDALEEVKVITSVASAEIGHAAGGGMQLTYKSGGNDPHLSVDDRLLYTPMVHRSYFQQTPSLPFSYYEFESVFSGPLYVPKLYNGKSKTFFLFGFAQHNENWDTENTVTVPTAEMLTGDFSFGGVGYPIYDPKSYRQVDGAWTADRFPNNIVPTSRLDPVAVKFLSYKPWQKANQPGITTASGTSNNFLSDGTKIVTRTRWDVKVDHQFSPAHKFAARYSQGHHRAQANGIQTQLAWNYLDLNSIKQPTDNIQGVFTDTLILSPTRFNEMRVGYSRRANTNVAYGVGEDWASKLGIPGVSGETFPQLNVGLSVGYSTPSYYTGEEFTFQDNLTQIVGTHNLKVGYEVIRARYNQANGATPAGSYNFGGTCLPSGGGCTNNTGNGFASFLLGSVSSATFSQRMANWLPRWWQHALYFQDDWKVRPGLTINVGVRWSYETPYKTKYDQQSQFDPTAMDKLTGLPGALLHPKGALVRGDWNNFQPRLGLAWHFAPKVVFRAGFSLMTQDIVGGAGSGNFQDYQASKTINQPTGDPRPQFYLSQGPGPLTYATAADGTFPYNGTSYSGRSATWLDPGLVNPYIMSWSGGIQYEFARNWLLELRYEGSAGNRLLGSWNINEIPLSITLGGNTALQSTVSGATQNYKPWTNFGTINLLSNLNHSTYHGGTFRIERRFANGFNMSAFDTWSKTMNGNDGEGGGGITYYNRSLEKAIAGYSKPHHFNAQATYVLPVGKGLRWLNKRGITDYILGGWAVSLNQTLDSGLPFGIGFSNSPYKYLTGTRIVPLTSVEDAKTAKWGMGPNRLPYSVPPQNPYLKASSFTYPAAYTTGYLGRNVFRAPMTNFQGFVVKKTVTLKERYKMTVRVDGHNLPFKQPNFTAPNTTWNTNTPQTFGSLSGLMGAWSEYGYQQATVQFGWRFEF